MVAIIDYGVGNLFSLQSSLNSLGIETCVTSRVDELRKADKIILPGVGAFEDAVKKLHEHGLFDELKKLAKEGKPLLGICLGMQMLFDKSYEFGEHCGLGLISGEVVPIQQVVSNDYKIPHIGWNSLNIKIGNTILKNISDGNHVYFVHSYYVKTDAQFVSSTTEYGAELTASVQYKNIFGTQFHPEKSGAVGLEILKTFCEFEGEII